MFQGSYTSPRHKPTKIGICELYLFPYDDQTLQFLTFDIFNQGYENYTENVFASLPYDIGLMERFIAYLPTARIVCKNKQVPEGNRWTTEISFSIGGEADWEFLRTLQDREWILVAKLKTGNWLQIGSNDPDGIERGADALIDYDSGTKTNPTATDYKFVWESSYAPIELIS